ncbi:GAF domain-containing protein [Rhodoflexus sp.]
MRQLIVRLSEAGINYLEGKETDLITRIKVANVSILLIMSAFLTLGIASVFLVPAISVNIIIQIIGLIAAYTLNFVGQHLLGRILFCFVFSIGMFLLHVQIVNVGEELLPATLIFQMTFWIIPLNLFHPKRERLWLMLTFFLSVFLVAILPYSLGIIEDPAINIEIFRYPSYFMIGTFVSSSVIAAFLLQSNTFYQQAKQKYIQSQNNLSAQNQQLIAENDSLKKSLSELRVLQASEEIRKKSITYQAELSEELRAHSNDLKMACDRAISLITRYIDANAGALFLHEGTADKGYLEMVACYANGRRKYINKKIACTQGLVGQAFMEKAYIVANNIPEEHINIASGLGEDNPTHLLLMPMIQNNEVSGVMEFASFRPFDPLVIEMAEKLANLTGSIIVATRVNQRTQELLAQSQHQTEDLRAREEEMRQNMEELAATQEELARINDELSNKSIAVSILLATVEMGIDKKILSCDDNFAEMMGYTKEELLTLTHPDLVPFDVYDRTEYEIWWDSLIAGKVSHDKFIRKTKSGKKITLNCCYRPIFSSATKDVIRVVKYCYPINSDA